MTKLLLCIGVQRAATTWLYRSLLQIDGVNGGVKKEVDFFRDEGRYCKGEDWYLSQFGQCRVGLDFTPEYLMSPSVLNRVQVFSKRHGVAVVPIVCLRNPLMRAASGLEKFYQDCGRKLSREHIIKYDLDGVIARSCIARQVALWLDAFPQCVFVSDDKRPRCKMGRIVTWSDVIGYEFEANTISTPMNATYGASVLARAARSCSAWLEKSSRGRAIKSGLTANSTVAKLFYQLTASNAGVEESLKLISEHPLLVQRLVDDLDDLGAIISDPFVDDWRSLITERKASNQ